MEEGPAAEAAPTPSLPNAAVSDESMMVRLSDAELNAVVVNGDADSQWS